MRSLKIWPVIISALVCGCSIQQHIDRVEHNWLRTKSQNTAFHGVSLPVSFDQSLTTQIGEDQPGELGKTQNFLNANGANTYFRGKVMSPQIRELSGLAAIIGETDKYWAINDSGNRPQLFALNGHGKHIAAIELSSRNRDWEDLASYRFQGENWIAVAETGDNLQRYPVSSITIFKQPALDSLPRQLAPIQRIDFTYEDGPRNVESVAVSAQEGKIYLIAKDRSDPAIYTLPLAAGHDKQTSDNLVATKVGRLGELRPTQDDVWWERLFGGRILYEATGFDISVDGRLAVVANYRHVYLFKRKFDESWASALTRVPAVISTHRMQQSESVAFSADSSEVIVSSEGVNAPMLSIRPSHSSKPAVGHQ